MKTKNKREEKQFKFSSLSSVTVVSHRAILKTYIGIVIRGMFKILPLFTAPILLGTAATAYLFVLGYEVAYLIAAVAGIHCEFIRIQLMAESHAQHPKQKISKPIFGIYLSTSTREFVCFALEFVYDPIPDNLKFRLPRTRNRKYLLRIQVAAQSTIS